jgi:hypothetical protein
VSARLVVQLAPVAALFSNASMPRWPDKIADVVRFDVAFALNFKVGRTLRPLTAQGGRQEHRRSLAAIELDNRARGAHTSPENWPKRPD